MQIGFLNLEISMIKTFSATAQANSPTFDIVINFTVNGQTVDPSYQNYFNYAAKMWELIIKGDVADQYGVVGVGYVDDVYIDASVISIDGVGNTLGQAGPLEVRPNNITTTGMMEFDVADLSGLVTDGSITSVILHEMGHVLGLGTLWENVALVTKIADQSKPDGFNYHYVGAAALAEYRLLSNNSGATFIQVESVLGGAGGGSIGGHWDETIFIDECMTGLVAAGFNPLSRMTLASLRDLGYVVDLGNADPYFLAATPMALRDDFSGNYNTSTTVAIGGTQNGVIELNEDNDWFQVNLIAGTGYTFTMKGSTAGLGTLSDAFLQLHAVDGEILASNDNFGAGTDSSFNFVANVSGLYYLDASAAGTQTGTYQLGISTYIPILFSEMNDTVNLVLAGQTWHALGGDDVVTGTSGIDIIYGDLGNDYIIGGVAADTLSGGDGYDVASYYSSVAGVNINLSLAGAQAGSGDGTGDVLSGFEAIDGSNVGNDTLTGDAAANYINGRGGNDYITGDAGADTLIGGDGYDVVNYNASAAGVNVNLNVTGAQAAGGDGAGDILSGFEAVVGSYAGNDIIVGDTVGNYIVGGGGNDYIIGGGGADTLIGGDGYDSVSYYTSAVGVNIDLNLTSAQTSAGDGAGDVISGFEAVYGSNTGNDVLIGDAKSNSIFGAGGNDSLTGGAGADSLVGGNGNDTFIYNLGFGLDVITDFTLGTGQTDVLRLLLGTAFDSFSEIMAAASQVGANTVFNIDATNSITCNNTLKSNFVADDFIFV
jgi:Ca2+-binding RTX toxin-like protein